MGTVVAGLLAEKKIPVILHDSRQESIDAGVVGIRNHFVRKAGVITSYSIHYTKLYEAKGPTRANNSLFTVPPFVNQSNFVFAEELVIQPV